jgi:osmotically-inducible protein OsmY
MTANKATIRLTVAALAMAMLLIAPAALAATTQPQTTDLTKVFIDRGVAVDGLQVTEVGGIVVMRGRVALREQAEQAGKIATELGYGRVANLIQVIEPIDDVRIERTAERELTIHRSLDGCRFSVDSKKGVISINGKVTHELQKDVAISLLRNIDGVREVRSTLARF